MNKAKTAAAPLKTSRTRKAKPVEAPPASERAAAAPPVTGKLGVMLDLLRRPQGARIADMTAATGWQAHSVRGAMSGALKKTRGIAVTSEKDVAGRVYRAPAQAQPTAEMKG